MTRTPAICGSDPKGENPERSGGVEGEASHSGGREADNRPTSPSSTPIDLERLKELLAEWRRLEDAFHDTVPDQGDTGDGGTSGRALCQFVYDNADTLRAALESVTTPIPPASGEASVTGALADVAAERRRQVQVEGWTAEHDDEHSKGEMLDAAICYAQRRSYARMFGNGVKELGVPARWPWDLGWWKPKDERRDLIRAAALIVAEIERLDRLNGAAPLPSEPTEVSAASDVEKAGPFTAGECQVHSEEEMDGAAVFAADGEPFCLIDADTVVGGDPLPRAHEIAAVLNNARAISTALFSSREGALEEAAALVDDIAKSAEALPDAAYDRGYKGALKLVSSQIRFLKSRSTLNEDSSHVGR